MNSVIKKQLAKVKVAQLPEIKDDDTTIIIPKFKEVVLEVGHCYKIEVADYVVNEPPNFNLASNWNGGTSPPSTELYIEVLQLLGKMVKVRSSTWEGWLPKGSILRIERL